jgi:hypothetical protein
MRPLPLLACSFALALGSAACESSQAVAPPKQPAASARTAPAVAVPPAPAAPAGHLARGEVDRVLTQGPPWLLRRVMREEVIRPDGKFAGWRLTGIPEEWTVDLRPGDVVTRVNGLPLETPDQAWEAWKSVAKNAELKITLLRDGGTRELVLPIDGGASSPETLRMLGRDGAPPPRRPQGGGSIQIGGETSSVDEEAY